jgi:TrwC relaxase
VRGLVAAAFTHRDSRAGDPDLHTHVEVANKVLTHDGRWLSIDGRVLFKAKVAVSETYNTSLEQHLRDALGVRLAERPGSDPGTQRVVDRGLMGPFAHDQLAHLTPFPVRGASVSTTVRSMTVPSEFTARIRLPKPSRLDRPGSTSAWSSSQRSAR